MFDNTTQVNGHRSNCGGPRVKNQLSKVPTSISTKNSQPRYHALSTPRSKEERDLVNLHLATVVAKVLPNLTLLRLLVRIRERTWAKQSPKFNNQAGCFNHIKPTSGRRDEQKPRNKEGSYLQRDHWFLSA